MPDDERGRRSHDPAGFRNLMLSASQVLPRLEHYKDSSSVHYAHRPTLDELLGDQSPEKVSSFGI